MLTISVLGPVEVKLDDRIVSVPGGKTAEVLVRLAIDAGKVVSADVLLDDVWGHESGQARRNTLQSKVVKLRRALGDPGLVESLNGGYRLTADAWVDARHVLSSAAEAAALADAGDDQLAAEVCAAARRVFTGDLLMGACDGEWVAPRRAQLDAAHLQLVETEAAARLRLGQVSDVIADLEQSVVVWPFHERLWELLIIALYRSGRQAEALAAYRRVRALLVDELGLDPGPQLKQLEAQILAHDPELGSGASDVVHMLGNLPTLRVELIGRSIERATISDLLADHPLVELVGPGGVGKTALAIAVAATVTAPGGVWLARLETTVSADEVIDAVIAALGVSGGPAALVERLKASASVLVLDNCEHVLDAVAEFVQSTLDAAPHTRLLCTSQIALAIDGEVVVDIDPLPIDDAIELFMRRAAVQRRSDVLDSAEARHSVAEVCRALDGLPLAIELAAARTKTLSIAEIGRRLDDRFELLNDPNSRRTERRRALRPTISWSYELLFPDDQRGLWALAGFAGGATLPAFTRVLTELDVPAGAALDVVTRLAARSLLIVDEAEGGAARYRMLDSVRAFASEAIAAAGFAELAFAAHAQWFAELARDSTHGTRGARQAEYLTVARAERPNIDAAIGWCVHHDPPLAVTIANGFAWAWIVLGDARGAQRIVTALDAAGDAVPMRERASGQLYAGWFEASLGDLAKARRHVDAATAIAERLGDVELRARCDYYLAYVVSHDGDFAGGMELTARSRAVYATLDHPWDLAANALFATRAAISAGDEAASVAAAEHATAAIADVDDPWLEVRYEAMLGELARLQHRFDDAVNHIGRAAATSNARGYRQTEAYQIASLGRAQCQAGDHKLGASTLRTAIARAEATGDVRMAALARVHLGRVQRALGDPMAARLTLEQAAEWHHRAGGGEQALLGDCLLAALDDNEQGLMRILNQAIQEHNAPVEVFAADALARLARQRGDDAAAADLSRRADAAMVTASHFISERDRVDAT